MGNKVNPVSFNGSVTPEQALLSAMNGVEEMESVIIISVNKGTPNRSVSVGCSDMNQIELLGAIEIAAAMLRS